jgi:hypothetical protein
MEHRVDTGDGRLKAFAGAQVAEYAFVNGWPLQVSC